jgi:hypothetical protein
MPDQGMLWYTRKGFTTTIIHQRLTIAFPDKGRNRSYGVEVYAVEYSAIMYT